MRPLSVRSDHRARPAPRLAPVILLMGLALVALAAPAPAEINFDAPFLAKGNGYVNRYLTVADFNGDGHPDVATGVFTDNSIHILLGRGDGTFTIGTPVPMSLSFGYLEAGDVNGDGFADIVTSNTGANVSVFLGHGDGTFGPRTDYATPASGTNRIMKIEDLNLDGIPDLIVSNSVFRGQLGSTLGTRIDLPFSPFAVGDMNGDGKPDLLTGGSDGVFCRLGHGDFTFDPPTTVFVPTYPTSVSQVQAADVNGDGKLDAVFLHSGTSSGTFAVCLGHGDGTFGPVAEFPCSQPPSRAITGDFNGDGRADVAAIVVPPNWGRMYRLGQPDGSLGPEQVFADGFELWGIETADVNGDGRDDVLSASSIGGSVCVALGNADGTLGHLSEYSTGMFSYGVLAGDLNGDGHPDAIVAESDSDSVAVLFGDCAAHLGAPLHLHS